MGTVSEFSKGNSIHMSLIILFALFFSCISGSREFNFHVQTWEPHNNVGDMILQEIFYKELAYYHNNTNLSLKPPYHAQYFMYTGGSILNPNEKDIFFYLNREPLFLHGTGFDDNYYNVRFDKHREFIYNYRTYTSGVPGFAAGLKPLLKALPSKIFGGVRGPLTKFILQLHDKTQNVNVIGDSGLLAGLAYQAHHISIDSKKERFPDARLIAGINIGEASLPIWHINRENMINRTGDAMIELWNRGYTIVTFLYRPKDIPIYKELIKYVVDKNSTVLDDRFFEEGGIWEYTSESAIQLFGYFDIVVGMKLHSAVFAAATEVPFLVWRYRMKIQDFIDYIKQPHLVLDDLVATPEDMKGKIDYIIDNELLLKQSFKSAIRLTADLHNCAWLNYTNVHTPVNVPDLCKTVSWDNYDGMTYRTHHYNSLILKYRFEKDMIPNINKDHEQKKPVGRTLNVPLTVIFFFIGFYASFDIYRATYFPKTKGKKKSNFSVMIGHKKAI
ncbi:hypothetical protein PCE1_003017 [Barthelona sp. PCE]